jgi:hypothetical protein
MRVLEFLRRLLKTSWSRQCAGTLTFPANFMLIGVIRAVRLYGDPLSHTAHLAW